MIHVALCPVAVCDLLLLLTLYPHVCMIYPLDACVVDRVTPGADDFLDSIHDSAAANSIRATSPTSTPGLMHMLAYILDGFLVWAIANPGLFFLYSAIVLLPFALIVTYAMCQIRKAGTKFKKLRTSSLISGLLYAFECVDCDYLILL